MNAISKAVLLAAIFATLLAISCSSDKNDDEGNVMVSSSSSNDISSSSIVSSSSSLTASSSSSVLASSSSSSSVGGGNSFARSYTSVDYASTGTRKHSRQRYDLQLPSTGDGPFPLVMYVHGGGFTGGNWELSQNNNGVIQLAKSRGYAVASIGYLLAGSQKAFPEAVEDVLAAIRHLRANADKYHLDPNRFAITGFSAGGYLTAIVCAVSGTDNHGYDVTSLGNAGVSSKVQAAASSAALTDFMKLDAHQQELGGSWMMSTHYNKGGNLSKLFGGGTNAVSTSTYGSALTLSNPLTHINANTPPIYMMHGTGDNLVPWKQSELMVTEMNKLKSGNATFEKVTDRGHADFDGATDSKTIAILDFLDKSLK